MAPHRLTASLTLALLPLLAGFGVADPLPDGAKARLGSARLRSSVAGGLSTITPDGKFFVGNSGGGSVGYFDPNSGKLVRTVRLDGDAGPVLGFSADGARGTGVGFRSAFVFDQQTGKLIARVARNTTTGDNAVALSRDGKRLAVSGMKAFTDKDKDKPPTAVVWDVDADRQLAEVAVLQNETVFVALSPDGKRLATWGYHYDRNAKDPVKPDNDPARIVQFWDATTGKETAKTPILTGYNPAAVVFSPDGSRAAVSNGEGSVYLFDPADGATKGLLLGRSRQGRKLAFSPDGKTLAAGGEDGSVQRWNVADGRRLGTTEPPVPIAFGLRAVQFIDNERLVAWTLKGVAAVAWEVPSGKLLTPAGGHVNAITAVAVVGDGKEVLTAASDGVILRCDPTTGKELGTIPLRVPGGGFGPGVVTASVALAPDGTRALAAEGSGGLGIYDLPAGTQQFVIPGDPNRNNRGAFTSDGARLVQTMTSFDPKKFPARVAVWDLATGRKLGEVEVPGVASVAAALSPDAKSLITAGQKPDDAGGGAFVVTGWELGSGKKLGEYSAPGGFGDGYVVAAGDNKSAVVTTPKSGVVVIDFVAGTKLRNLETRGRRPNIPPVVSPDGKSVALAFSPGFAEIPAATISLIDITTGNVKRTLTAERSEASALAFSRDGKVLVAGFRDTTALVWEIGP